MSCTSTAASSAAFSAAYLSEPALTRAQVQSLFHSLRRQGAEAQAAAPDGSAYRAGMDRLELRVRSDPALSGQEQASLLRRIAQARDDAVPDGATWHAICEIRAHASVAAARLAERFEQVGRDLGAPAEEVAARFAQWRDADASHFEDYPAPAGRFRYDRDPAVPADAGTQRALRRLGYEHYLAQPYPVFVYGTLRRGHGNHALLQGAAERIGVATAPGIAVYGSGYGFPYAAEHPDADAVTRGEIVWLSHDEAGALARENLDYLEGFYPDFPSASHYERVLRPVVTEGADGSPATVPAWLYLARGRARARLQEADRIPHGDWSPTQSRPA